MSEKSLSGPQWQRPEDTDSSIFPHGHPQRRVVLEGQGGKARPRSSLPMPRGGRIDYNASRAISIVRENRQAGIGESVLDFPRA